MSFYGPRYDRAEWQTIQEVARRWNLPIATARAIVKFVVSSGQRAEQDSYEDWRDR